MVDIVTLTINPAVDVSTSVPRIMPMSKLRAAAEQRHPGGGGINVARVARRFDADVLAVYTAGGAIGQLLQRLVQQEGIGGVTVPIAGDTREDFTVLESDTGQQFRFVLPGPVLDEQEWRNCLAAFTSFESPPNFLIASGSLPPGAPDDFYARVVQATGAAGTRVVVDTSGPPLTRALEAGVYLVKPSLREMRELTGERLESEADCIAASRRLIELGHAQVVALTLGHYGALLVTRTQALRASPLPIKPLSTVGAGDSFLGAMIIRLAAGRGLEDAFRYAVAAGSAALLAAGTNLCAPEDVERLLPAVVVQEAIPSGGQSPQLG